MYRKICVFFFCSVGFGLIEWYWSDAQAELKHVLLFKD